MKQMITTQPTVYYRLMVRTLIVVAALVLCSCANLSGFSSQSTDRLKQNALAGDAPSQYQLGLSYTSGTGVWQSDSAAATWFEKAAVQGHADAAYMLGISYLTGNGVAADDRQAVRWFERAANQGNARAQYQLGVAYMNGRGVEVDQAWAARWYGKAANQGHADAQYALGVAFARGLGLPVHPLQGCKWLTLAAKSGPTQTAPEQVRRKVCDGLRADRRQRAEYLASSWRPRKSIGRYSDQPTVFYIQHRLSQLGYDPGYVDGFRGAQTNRAIKRYAKDSVGAYGASNRDLVEQLRKTRS